MRRAFSISIPVALSSYTCGQVRRQVFDDTVSGRAKEIFEYIAPNYNITLEEWNHDKDHVHILFRAHPNTEISKFINAYKSASSRLLKKEFPQIRQKLWKERFWSQNFFKQPTTGFPRFKSKKRNKSSYSTICINGNITISNGYRLRSVTVSQTPGGKSRPWILWMSVPYALSAILLFTVPHTMGMVHSVYIFVTYNFCTTVCYTAINLPYGSLSVMMTRVSSKRDMLSVVRMGLSPLGKIIAVTCTTPLVKLFGKDQAAWVKTMMVWAVIALILLLICFINCKETVVIAGKEKAEKVPVGKGLKLLVTNQYFWAVLLLWMFQSVFFSVSGTILPYYCKYIFKNDTWLYSALYLAEILTMVVCIFLCAPLIRKFGKRNIALAGSCIALGGQLLFFLNPYSLPWTVMSCLARAVGLAPLNAVVFGMIGDVVEFGQWKTHVRQKSLIFAVGSIGTKVGAGVASAAMTVLMSFAGYISTSSGMATQPQSALNMIIQIYKFGSLIVAGGVLIVLLFYKLDKKYADIMKELIDREARGEL